VFKGYVHFIVRFSVYSVDDEQTKAKALVVPMRDFNLPSNNNSKHNTNNNNNNNNSNRVKRAI